MVACVERSDGFSRIHASIFSRFGCSVHKHIQEGICLPATAGRHITTRN